jgi:hypothetical protein
MRGKETSRTRFAISRARITRPFYHAGKKKSILFLFFAYFCGIFLHFGGGDALFWGIYIKKYENFEKTLDKKAPL